VRTGRGAGDEGTTLVETIVSLALVMTAMAAMGTYFVNSFLVVNGQRTAQTAAQVANSSIEQIRGLRGNSLAANRSQGVVDSQWASGLTNDAVKTYLTDMDEAYDPLAAAGSGPDAAISTSTQTVKADGTNFSRTIYVGACYLYTGLPTGTSNVYSNDISNNCQPRAQSTDQLLGKFLNTPRELQFYRAVVLLTWTGHGCAGDTCNYVVSTLISRQAEPTFDVHQPAPVIQSAAVDLYQNTAASFPVKVLYGQLPNTFSQTGFPAGLSITTGGVITGSTAITGLTKPNVKVIDSLGRSDTEAITLTVWPQLTLTGITDTSSRVGDVISQVAKAQGGVTTGPGYTFSASGLPAGLTLNTDGTITGTVTTPGSYAVTITVTDGNQTLDSPAQATLKYTHTVYPSLTLAAIPDQQVNLGSALSVTASGAGGDGKLTYSATGLPLGMSMNSTTGVLSGTPTVPGRYLPLVTVSDGSGGSASVRFSLQVNATTGLLFTSPSPTAADQTSAVGKQTKLDLSDNSKALGLSPTLSVTGLPPGLTANLVNGSISGKPTTAGTYVVTAVVTNVLPPQSSVLTFLWTVS
jgi:type II secretory pathway pseudopilin PulG